MSQHFTVTWKQVADIIARQVVPFAVPGSRLRKDIGNVQVGGPVIIKEVSGEVPAVLLAFEMEGEYGVELQVKLPEFAADPAAYIRDLLENLRGIRYSADRRRLGRQAEIAAVYEGLPNG
ncbi:hypothetical protein ACUHOO_000789 [Pseudomonas aeruginosa]|jgi:hypothetical protein|uniref:hypothetical protein n=1 Tax=Pseudomonas aeruginosa TaxID=287 RepID=UPI0002E8ECB5|nr:hypothetical protein [Pseudomonas aeruginosa]EIU3316461.1 hypothetical protein [Pseudomonas aeruginosa]EIY2512148.1 hypothetical protein [Pseudomonas aeruginosa]EIY2820320.1 hypothetical protein [Pseudomonas aeruginosa]EKU2957371.1 hypothetical protein [Pseudomonas aeruginosa]EKV3063350.1 hypothetical protein [Pseudomonas aeruginosa]